MLFVDVDYGAIKTKLMKIDPNFFVDFDNHWKKFSVTFRYHHQKHFTLQELISMRNYSN